MPITKQARPGRYDVTDRSRYAARSVTKQYQETDLQLVTRLLAEEGLYYYFEHTRDGHTLVINDGVTQTVSALMS